MIKAIFFDIDGTLIDFNTHEIPDSTKETLYALKEKGYYLFIASGRPPIQLELLCETFKNFPWDGKVLLNGQYCMDKDDHVFHKMPLPKEAMKTLVPYLLKADYPCSIFELDYSYDIRFNQNMYDYLKSIGREDKMPPMDSPERTYTHDTYQICPYIPEEMDDEFLSHAPGMKSARWTPAFADIIPAEGGKPAGIMKMLERYDLKQEECMAFGDGGNDITMLEFASIGVAMGNAEDRVKAHADYVTDRIENDGIRNACIHFKLM